MKNSIINYKRYVITVEEGVEKGIFFRSPIQNVFFDAYYPDAPISAYTFIKNIKNPIRRLYEIIIGNKHAVDNVTEWENECNWGGFDGNIICLPIYFKRTYRKLTAYSCNDENIESIESYGYESEFDYCAGHCAVEYTTIRLRTGKTIRIKRRESFHFTYSHIVEKIIDGRSDYA